MAGLFRKAQESFVGGKFFAFGETGSGKSMFILTFPKVAAIDTEAGLSDYEGKHDNLVFVANTTSHKEVHDALEEVENFVDTGEIETIAIDSETKIYDSMQITSMELEERRARQKGGDIDDANVSMRGWGKIKNITKKLQSTKIDLSTKGLFVVSTAQASDVKKKVGEEMVKIGEKPDAHKSLSFDYDVILRFFVEEAFEKGKKVPKYKAEVLKDRTGTFQKYDIIDNPSFNMWKPYYDAKKGKGIVKPPTHYKADTDTDEKAMVDEDNAIENAKKLLSIVIKSAGKESAMQILKDCGIKNGVKGIDTLKIANEVIKKCEEVIKETGSEDSEE